MSDSSIQESLFEDPLGLRFRQAREKTRRSLESFAHELRLPVSVLDAIEREDWSRLGAPIFVRSYVGSYAKALGLPVSIAEDVVRGKPAPQLNVIGGSSPSRRVLDRGLLKLAYLVMTVVIIGSIVMLAMHYQTPRRSADVLPLDPPGNYSEASGAIHGEVAGHAAGSPPGTAAAPAEASGSPVLASLAPQLSVLGAAGDRDLLLHLRAPSWIDVRARDGSSLERGVLPAGSERRFSAGHWAQVTLGDATAVQVMQGRTVLDLTPFVEAKVARFTVSSDGKILPVASD